MDPSYSEWKKCYFCNGDFQEKNNIGLLYCRIHPGIKILNNNGKCFYSCCGVEVDKYDNHFLYKFTDPLGYPNKIGCLKIDHFDLETLIEKDIVIKQYNFHDKNFYIEKSFSTSDIKQKISEIKNLSIICVNNKLYKNGLSYPKRECIFYDTYTLKSKLNNINIFNKSQLDIKRFNLNIYNSAAHYLLNTESKRNKFKTLDNNTIYYDYNSDDNYIEYDLNSIENQLKNSKMDYGEDEDENIQNIWKNNIQNNSDEFKENSGEKEFVDFKVISRIDTKLSYNSDGYYS